VLHGHGCIVIRESGLTITELELELLWLSHRPALSPVEVRVHHMTQISKKKQANSTNLEYLNTFNNKFPSNRCFIITNNISL